MLRIGIVVAILIYCTVLLGDNQHKGPAEPGIETSELQLVLSIVWHGRSLHNHNLNALRNLRAKFPDLPVFHLISPTYFLRSDLQADAKVIQSFIGSSDRVGIYLGAWKSLAHHAGVGFRSEPTLWGNAINACGKDCGEEVALSFYPETSVTAMFAAGIKILQAEGISPVDAYLVAGHLGDNTSARVAASFGIEFDLNPMPLEWVKKRLAPFPAFDWLSELWRDITPDSRPYVRDTDSTALTTIPLTAGSLEYLSQERVLTEIDKDIEGVRSGRGNQLVHLQLSQETALQYSPPLSIVLQEVYDRAAKAGVSVVVDTFARRAATPVVAPEQVPALESSNESGSLAH